MANNVPPTDATGREKARLQEAHAKEIKANQGRMSMTVAAEAEQNNDIVDLSEHDNPADRQTDELNRRGPQVQPADAQKNLVEDLGPVPQFEENDLEVANPTRTMRVNTPLEQMTFGHGTSYNFELGRRYKVSKPLYDHLDELGYVYH